MGFTQRRSQLKATVKPREEWWSRVFATPAANIILLAVADWRIVTPNRLTVLSLFLAILSAALILRGGYGLLIAAGVILQISYIIDCMDGQLARYRNVASKVGSFLDKWSDFVKFPIVILALSVEAYSSAQTVAPIILGISSVFLICYLPYLKMFVLNDFGIAPWKILSGKDFLQRNLRFFLFEESQLYLMVSIGLFFHSSIGALVALTVTQGGIAIAQTIRVFVLIKKSSK
ncbi:MAG: CDP-alcohol phosphatidyltransferase family protein [Alphaproteobacteria bacterium]|nr:CDP-alcohol phosphatidyltransferase family protein [Alphaproteobacteria bacterium]